MRVTLKCLSGGVLAIRALGLGLMAGCAGNSGGEAARGAAGESFGAGYPPGSAAWSGEARGAYRTAFLAGIQDQKEGYRYDDDRGALVLAVEERGFYRQGYRRGYYHEANLRRQERRAPAGAAEQQDGEVDGP